uniref:hypothetical protein n=1 Tax=uncultured Dysgonomonas sp. TaxID=206096 RepID=UPI0026376DBB|nr:hypothetical protein [uncultured Dysgonomonas sp.]
MIEKLTQKKGFNFRKFQLYNNKIIIEERSASKITKYDIELDEIGYRIYHEKDNTTIGQIVTWIFVCIPFILIIIYFLEDDKKGGLGIIAFNTVIWWGFALFSFLKQNKDDLILTGGQSSISFYRNKPNEQNVLDFIKILIEVSKKYIRDKHLIFKEYETEEEIINRLKWMLAIEVITNKEYDIIREELKKRSLF